MLCCIIVILTATVALAEPAVTTILVSTRDGSEVGGETELQLVKVKTTMGTVDITMDKIRWIATSEDGIIVETWDGNKLKGEVSPESWKVKSTIGEFTVDLKSINSIRFLSGAGADAPARRVPLSEPRAVTGPGAPVPAPPPPPEPDVLPEQTLALNASLKDLTLSPDRKSLYLLDLSGSRLLFVDAESLNLVSAISLTAQENCLSLSCDGKTIALAGTRTLTVVDVGTKTVIKSLALEEDVRSVCAKNRDIVYALGVSSHVNSAFMTISIPKQSVVEAVSCPGDWLLPCADGKKIYTGERAVILPERETGATVYSVETTGSHPMHLSVDGRFAVTSDGRVLRTGRSYLADLLLHGTMERNDAIAFMPDRTSAILFLPTGFMKWYNLSSCEIQKSWNLQRRVLEVVPEGTTGLVYALASTASVDAQNSGGPTTCNLISLRIPDQLTGQ